MRGRILSIPYFCGTRPSPQSIPGGLSYFRCLKKKRGICFIAQSFGNADFFFDPFESAIRFPSHLGAPEEVVHVKRPSSGYTVRQFISNYLINRINHIKNFGSFVDFNWSSIRDFGRVNLFFGWNYSGKTTLSRIFSSFESCVNYHEESEFSISLDGMGADESNLESCQIIDTDFIARNINGLNVKPILSPS